MKLPAVAVWYLRGGFRLPPAGLGFASEVREGRGGQGRAQLVVFLACGGGGGFRGGRLSADAPLSTRAKREMLMRRPRCAARSKALLLWWGLFFFQLFQSP